MHHPFSGCPYFNCLYHHGHAEVAALHTLAFAHTIGQIVVSVGAVILDLDGI